MPFPLWLLTLGAAGYGAKKCVDAHDDQNLAEALSKQASLVVAVSQQRLRQTRSGAEAKLAGLGHLKLGIAARQLGRFVHLAQAVRRVEMPVLSDWVQPVLIGAREGELVEMRAVALRANQLIYGGALALGSGILTSVAGYGLTMTFASASTGTAIATLSGAAATNATLAWLGGGSVAAGGLGVAGGTVTLGLLAAGPALLVGGAIVAAKARENLATARANLAEARRVSAEMDVAASMLTGVGQVVDQYQDILRALEERASLVFDKFEGLLQRWGTNYQRFGQAQRKDFWAVFMFARTLRHVIDLPLFPSAGGSTADTSPALLAASQLLLGPGQGR